MQVDPADNKAAQAALARFSSRLRNRTRHNGNPPLVTTESSAGVRFRVSRAVWRALIAAL